MIARVQGSIAGKDDDRLVVAVGPIAMDIFVPEPLWTASRVGENVTLYTHLHVRENGLSLFGFATVEERVFFRLLLAVPGVGPKLALTVLSVLSPAALARAIQQETPELLTRVPGIGQKSAAKIIFTLKDKLPGGGEPAPISTLDEVDMEVVEALVTLGYSVVEAQRAVQGLPDELTTVEDRLRTALSRLA